MRTLLDFKFVHKYYAEDGAPGEGNNRTGKSGEDKVIYVPQGTVIKDENGRVVVITSYSIHYTKLYDAG